MQSEWSSRIEKDPARSLLSLSSRSTGSKDVDGPEQLGEKGGGGGEAITSGPINNSGRALWPLRSIRADSPTSVNGGG